MRTYQAGRHEDARNALALLVNDEGVADIALRQQARVYLGEVLYVQGEQEAAFKAFELVLTEDPSFRIDPFRHPPDVCGFFEVVRASITPIQDLRPPLDPLPPPRFPAIGYMGFGLYQLREGQAAMGTLLLSGQVICGAISVVDFGLLVADRRYIETDDLAKAAMQRRLWTQWGTTAGFWGLHVWGTLDARADWRQRAPLTASLPLEASIGWSGRW